MITTLDAQRIASSGGGLRLNASRFSPLDLQRIASSASDTGARINIYNVSGLSPLEMQRIGSSGKGCVQFELD